jgi:hypothetical protein
MKSARWSRSIEVAGCARIWPNRSTVQSPPRASISRTSSSRSRHAHACSRRRSECSSTISKSPCTLRQNARPASLSVPGDRGEVFMVLYFRPGQGPRTKCGRCRSRPAGCQRFDRPRWHNALTQRTRPFSLKMWTGAAGAFLTGHLAPCRHELLKHAPDHGHASAVHVLSSSNSPISRKHSEYVVALMRPVLRSAASSST